MSVLRVALLQMAASGFDQAANRDTGEDFCRRAKAMDADIALFPEMWNVGYTFFDRAEADAEERWRGQAVGPDSAFVTRFRALARELGMAIAVTYLEAWEPAPRNSVSVIDRHGDIVLTYAKVHTCAFDKECAITPGDGFHVCTLDTAKGPVVIGCMICYDREFPESARILMLQGAEIILTPNACELEDNRIGQFRARAFENMVGLAMANYAAPQQNGHSIAFRPEAFSADESPASPLVVEAGEDEGVYMADFDLDHLRDYRRRETWGNAYRRPDVYGRLTETAVSEPFIREPVRPTWHGQGR